MRKARLRNHTNVMARFWKRVEKTETCWLWTGKPTHNGYGQFWHHGVFACHRVSYEEHFGPIPDDKFVLHRCDVKLCVRPDHLHLGTHKDNVDDARLNNIALGRPVEISRKLVADMRKQGLNFRQISAELGCSISTAYRASNT